MASRISVLRFGCIMSKLIKFNFDTGSLLNSSLVDIAVLLHIRYFLACIMEHEKGVHS